MQTLKFYPVNREVFLNGIKLAPEHSQSLINHSPDGFSWGYGGSGPAQLSLAILLRFLLPEEALDKYQQFKWAVISMIPNTDEVVELDIDIPLYLEKGKAAIGILRPKMLGVDTSPRIEVAAPSCGKGWAERCSKAKSKSCTCGCGGQNHGKSH